MKMMKVLQLRSLQSKIIGNIAHYAQLQGIYGYIPCENTFHILGNHCIKLGAAMS